MSIPNTVVTEDGRTLHLREINPGDMLDLIEAAGSAMSSASAGAWLNFAQMLATVHQIDDEPIPFPTTREEIKILARRVENSGVKALQAVFEDATESKAETDTAKN